MRLVRSKLSQAASGNASAAARAAVRTSLNTAREHRVAAGALPRDLGESVGRLLMLAGFGQRHRRLEGGARFGRFASLPVVVAAPGADARNDQDQNHDQMRAVTLPELFQPLAP